MIRRRRFPLVSRVCIGTFLLLFSIATTDTIKGPSTTLEKVHFPETETIFQKNRTILKKVPADESELVSAENDQSVDLINAEDQDVGKSIKAQDEEKVPTSKDHKVQGIRSHDEVDRLSTSDSTSGSRFEEILYGTSGKSSSTKAISEDFYRLPRTNGLTTVTTKPAFEDSRLEEKKNKTIINPSQQVENNTNYLTNGSKLVLENTFKEEKQETDKKGLQRTLILESKNSYLSSNVDDHGDRESTTQRSIREAFDEKEKEDSYSKNSEVTDLKSIAEKNGNGEPISLINDTYVNYSHYYKTSTEKNLEASSGNQSRVSKNGTNFISKDSGVSHEWQDPKEEVEVVRNVTHTPIERLVDEVRNLERSQNTSRREDANFDNELNDKRSKDNIITYNATKVKENEAETEKQESLSEIHHLKPMGNTTLGSNENIKDEGQTPLPLNNSNPVARGRTIAFSGINEFPDLETKTTATSKEIDVPLLKKNISIEKTIEQKPYPYVKSTMEPVLVRNSSNRVIEHTTEETSAYENTIERGRSEEKFVVTEPSVVIENSIQQFKPTYYDKLKNESLNNSTTQSSSPMTTLSSALEDVKPTNQTLVHQSYDLKTTEKRLQEQSINPENDVPGGNEGSQVITEKENFDVTGNGITEVSLKPEISDNANKRTTQRSYELSFHAEITNRTTLIPVTSDFTEKPQTEAKIISNMDVQRSSEESLLTRSTLNVTEASTEYSLTKENSTENEKSTTLFSLPLNYTVAKIPESTTMTPTILTHEIAKANVSSPRTVDTNGTNEIPSGVNITSNPEENSLPTTTSVEYEFVGLTEATILPNENITEAPQHPEGQAEITTTMTPVSTVKDIMTKNSSEEVSTIGPENVTDNSPTSESEKDDDIDRLSTTPIIDQTTIPTSMPGPTTLKDFTISSITEEQTDQTTREEDIKKTTIVIDTWSTTSDEDIVTGMSTEVLFDSSSAKDSNLIPNVTEVPVTESVSILNITTDTTRETTLIDSLPSTLHPKILAESTKSTPSTSEMPIDRTTDVSLMSLSPDEIKSLVRIVMKGTWLEVCRHMETLRVTLAEILKSGMNKSVYANQIRFHQNPCLEPPTQTPMPTDMPLTSVLVYVVDENGKFDSSMTSILPSLYNDSRDSFPVTENDSGNAIVVIVVSSVAFICLVLLAGLLFIMRKRQTRFNYGERCRPVSLDAYSLDSVSAYNSVRRKDVARSSKRSYGNPTFEDSSAIPSHPLNFAGLSSFCNDVNAINEEFSGIPQVSAKIDELPSGAEVKNRYANVIPLPETRVPLQKMNNDPLTEYINASYVRGPKNATRYYIACQGPMETTVTDFWRMIWEQQCKVIIMLTDLVENGVEKCTEYIPPSEVTDCHRLYGDYQVTLKKRETKEKYAISTLHLKNLENNTFREIYHIWYLWPVNGVQSDGAGLIAVLLEARALQRGGPGPIVVHCSPGTGRTGTLITLDLGIRQYEITRTVDVPRVVYTIRRDRAGAVQTKEQYAFIYKALNLYATKLAGGVLEST